MSASGEAGRVADALLARIVAGSYPPGLRLPSEIDLAQSLGCGRSTIREALAQLAALGVVRSRRGSGAMVLDFRREGTPALLAPYLRAGRFERGTRSLAVELLRLRALFAAEAVRLAALYAEPGALDEAKRLLAAAPSLESDPPAHALHELELFRALVFASGIWPATWLANAFWGPMREVYAALAPSIGAVPPGYQHHMEGLLDLVERRDEEGAVVHIRKWLERVDANLLGQLDGILSAVPALPSMGPPPMTAPVPSTRGTAAFEVAQSPRPAAQTDEAVRAREASR